MTIMEWDELVNKRISLDGEYTQEDGFINEIRFDSGKTRTWSKNTYVPNVYPELHLLLNKIYAVDEKGNTEWARFDFWYKSVLRNGILPFYFPKLENSKDTAVYQFIPNSLSYDRPDGIVKASFGLREVAQMDGQVPSSQWVTLEDQDASDELPSSGKVQRILQQVRNFLKWVKDQLVGRNEWLPPVNTTVELNKYTNLSPSINYLCKVVADPVQSGVYQRVAGASAWALYDTTVDFVNEQEFAIHTNNKNNPHEVTKSQIGLGNVTNDAQVKRSEMGAANGVATLNSSGKIPSSQLDPALNRTVGSNDNATGTVIDTGNNISVPIQVTPDAPSANSAQTTNATRSLRAQIKIMVDNIAHLFANKASYIQASNQNLDTLRTKGFYSGTFTNGPAGASQVYGSCIVQETTFGSSQYVNQIFIPEGNDEDLYWRTTNSPTSWGAWKNAGAGGGTAGLDGGFGTSNTGSNVAAKVVVLPGFTRSVGAIVGVNFAYTNAVSNPTLDVNSTGAAPIIDYMTGAAPPSSNSPMRATKHLFQFDGTNWLLLNPIPGASRVLMGYSLDVNEISSPPLPGAAYDSVYDVIQRIWGRLAYLFSQVYYNSGTSWYIKFPGRFILQGGRVSSPLVGAYTFTFPQPMADTNYLLLGQGVDSGNDSSTGGWQMATGMSALTTTGARVSQYIGSVLTHYIVFGLAAP